MLQRQIKKSTRMDEKLIAAMVVDHVQGHKVIDSISRYVHPTQYESMVAIRFKDGETSLVYCLSSPNGNFRTWLRKALIDCLGYEKGSPEFYKIDNGTTYPKTVKEYRRQRDQWFELPGENYYE